ncbi:HPP family protein [Natrinema soli]|uniref:HPP family protein n=1 Tax=Natrinema soli TaxID=1930624 RepID=A0ABD5SSZ2_9EURY|nr:HPP family protein [Natrinema soli]
MREGAAFSTLYVGVLLAVPGLLAWITGQAFIFPSLGPSAFLLATVRESEVTAPRRVIGGHGIGVVAGLIAYHAIAPDLGVSVTTAAPVLATAQLRFVASGVVAVVLTSGGMLATETVHPPACATTLIVSLGLLSSIVDGVLIMLAVVVLVAAHKLVMHGRSFDDYVPLGQ